METLLTYSNDSLGLNDEHEISPVFIYELYTLRIFLTRMLFIFIRVKLEERTGRNIFMTFWPTLKLSISRLEVEEKLFLPLVTATTSDHDSNIV